MAAPNEPDTDIAAVQAIVSALRPLEPADRERVLAAVSALLGMVPAARTASVAAQEPPAAAVTEAALTGIVDIRSLKETKQPRSANEMAAVAAYYLANLAPTGDRRETVGSADMDRLFKQGGVPVAPQAQYAFAKRRGPPGTSIRLDVLSTVLIRWGTTSLSMRFQQVEPALREPSAQVEPQQRGLLLLRSAVQLHRRGSHRSDAPDRCQRRALGRGFANSLRPSERPSVGRWRRQSILASCSLWDVNSFRTTSDRHDPSSPQPGRPTTSSPALIRQRMTS